MTTVIMLSLRVKIISKIISPVTTVLWGEIFFRCLRRRRSKAPINVNITKRILVVRLDEIGDVVLFLPFLRELRGNASGAWVTLVVKPTTKNLVELCPYIDELITFDGKLLSFTPSLSQYYGAFQFAKKHLWKQCFDAALLTRWDFDQSGAVVLSYFSGATKRIGYSETVSPLKINFNNGYDCLLTETIRTSSEHELERNLDVLLALGGSVKNSELEVWLSNADKSYADQLFEQSCIGAADKVVAYGIGASERRKTWPVKNFLELGQFLLKEFCSHIVVVGSDSDHSLGHYLQDELGVKVINIAGQTTLRQAAAVLRKCDMFIGNDSGPMHLASAVKTPVIEVSCHPQQGPTSHRYSPVRFGPRSPVAISLQPLLPVSPCIDSCEADQAHCILGVTVSNVIEAARLLCKQVEGHRHE